MSRPWILVAPSKTGIGYALTRHLLLNTHPSIPILAAGMDKTSQKISLFEGLPDRNSLRDRLHTLPLDVTSESTIASVSRRAASLFPPQTHHLHLAFCLPNSSFTSNSESDEQNPKNCNKLEETQATDAFKHNTIFPMIMMKHFGAFLPQNKQKQPFLHHTSTEESDEPTRIIQAEDDMVDNHPPSTWAGSAGGYGGPGESDPYLEARAQAQAQDRPRPGRPTQNQNPVEEGNGFQTLPPHAIWTNLSVRATDPSRHLQRASQCASDSLTRSFDDHLRHQKAQALAVSYSMNPGTVGDGQSENWANSSDVSLFTPNLKDGQDAAAKMANVILNMKASQRGRTWDWKGEEVSP